MPSAASAQRQGQIIAKQFKSFAKPLAEYKKHPEKFLGKPNLPGYKKKYRAFCVGRNGYKIDDHRLSITGGELVDFRRVCKSKAVKDQMQKRQGSGRRLKDYLPGHSFIIELTYRKKEEKRTHTIRP